MFIEMHIGLFIGLSIMTFLGGMYCMTGVYEELQKRDYRIGLKKSILKHREYRI